MARAAQVTMEGGRKMVCVWIEVESSDEVPVWLGYQQPSGTTNHNAAL
ncbi:hypothetical protein RBSH_02780 [Rhodopirellula baltica SH28]|uniref:Uncharacterized protein n=1 Tax=Rhodopirellula baltica SH28 TaxID=993517 RepID=K5CDY5_RHOBT|nr:hypothetical protein RBSH_02780 [Rhodopirellula baltica SH28]